jgi:hypothetical protein
MKTILQNIKLKIKRLLNFLCFPSRSEFNVPQKFKRLLKEKGKKFIEIILNN